MAVVGEPSYKKDVIKSALENAVEMANKKEVRCKVLISGTEMARQPGKDHTPWIMVSYNNTVKSSTLKDIRLLIHPNYDWKCIGESSKRTERRYMLVRAQAQCQ